MAGYQYDEDHREVAAGQTDSLLGAAGRVGQKLTRLTMSVATPATSAVSIKDGNGSAIPVLAANAPIGVYNFELGARCKNAITPGWRVTTGAGVSLMAVGDFS